MEEYLNNLLDQIRCKKAHAAIREELESHISDQIEDNMKAGMTREEAEKAAVCDMGDPVTTGISLDQIHRPKMARQMIVLMAVILSDVFYLSSGLYKDCSNCKSDRCRNYPGWYLCFIFWSQVRWKHFCSQSVMV